MLSIRVTLTAVAMASVTMISGWWGRKVKPSLGLSIARLRVTTGPSDVAHRTLHLPGSVLRRISLNSSGGRGALVAMIVDCERVKPIVRFR